MNAAGWLSASRLWLLPLAVLPVALHWDEGWLAAAAVTAIAGLSDFADGYLARRLNASSARGAGLDLLGDKVFIVGMLAMLAYYGLVELWILLVVVAREAVVTLLRLRRRSAPAVKVDFWGKTKTFASFCAVGWVILAEAFESGSVLGRFNAGGFLERLLSLAPYALAAAVILTLASGVNYVWKYALSFSRQLR